MLLGCLIGLCQLLLTASFFNQGFDQWDMPSVTVFGGDVGATSEPFSPCTFQYTHTQQPEQEFSQNPVGVVVVEQLVQRLLPQLRHLFRLSLEPSNGSHGWFSVKVIKSFVHIHGTSGVELASGVHWFLKYFAGCSVSWNATGGLQLNHDSFTAAGLARMESKGQVRVERAVPFSFYQNVVTMSYSMAFWDWDR